MNPTKNIIRAALQQYTKLNVMVIPLDGEFEEMLSKTEHNIFVYPDLATFQWNPNTLSGFNTLIDTNIPPNLDIDVIICNHRATQYAAALHLSAALHVPMILIDHVHPQGIIAEEDILKAKEQQRANISICMSNDLAKDWHLDRVVNYGLEVEPNYESNSAVLMVGTFIQQDMQNIQNVMQAAQTQIIENNAEQNKNKEDLLDLYKKSGIYISMSKYNYLPISMLKAMANGCAVISINTEAMKHIVTHGENGFLVDSLPEFHTYIQRLQTDDKLRMTIGKNALETIQTHFNLNTFKETMNSVFQDVRHIVFRR